MVATLVRFPVADPIPGHRSYTAFGFTSSFDVWRAAWQRGRDLPVAEVAPGDTWMVGSARPGHEPYIVSLIGEHRCSCPSGRLDRLCKHVACVAGLLARAAAQSAHDAELVAASAVPPPAAPVVVDWSWNFE